MQALLIQETLQSTKMPTLQSQDFGLNPNSATFNSVAMGELFNLPVPQFLYLQDGHTTLCYCEDCMSSGVKTLSTMPSM